MIDLASAARLLVVSSDNMEPSLCVGRHVAVLRPAAGYQGEGMYWLHGETFRLCDVGAGGIRAYHINKRYSGVDTYSREEFAAAGPEKVVAVIELLDHDDRQRLWSAVDEARRAGSPTLPAKLAA